MAIAVETEHPDVYVVEGRGTPQVSGASANVGGLIGETQKGPIDRAILITGMEDYIRWFGQRYHGGYMYTAARGFFQNGGRVLQVVRILRYNPLTGAPTFAYSETTLGDTDFIDTPASVVGSNAAPFNAEPLDTLVVNIDALGNQTVTFNATPAALPGAPVGALPPAPGSSITITVDSEPDPQVITFTGAEITAALAIAAINTQLRGGFATDPGAGTIDLYSDTRGTSSSIAITAEAPPGTAAILGHAVPSSAAGGGDVGDIDRMSIADAVSHLDTNIANAAVTAVGNSVKITSDSPGAGSSVQIVSGNMTTVLGLAIGTYTGSDAGQEDALKLQAKDPGQYGDNIGVSTLRWSTAVNHAGGYAPGVGAVVVMEVDSIQGAAIGDVLVVEDTATMSQSFIGLVVDIDAAANELTLHSGDNANPGNANAINDDSPVLCASTHRLATTSAEDLENGDTELLLTSAYSAVVGQNVVVVSSDGQNVVEVTVTEVDGNKIKFAAVALTTTIDAGAAVVSEEFNLYVYEQGLVEEDYEYLSMSSTNEDDYVQIRLAGISNESDRVVATDQTPTPTYDWQKLPYPVTLTSLTGGSDGDPVQPMDYIGYPGDVPPKSGIYLMEDVPDLNMIAIPGQTDEAAQEGIGSWCENNGVVDCILDPPLTADTPTDVVNYRLYTLPLDTSHATMYYPWLRIADELNADRRENIPPSGHVMGAWAATGTTRGVHVAPANIALRGIVGVARQINDAEHGLLNTNNINAIRQYPGQGIRIMGARTLYSVSDGRHYVNVRRLVNYVKRSIKEGNRWAIFENNDPYLWDQIQTINGDFLSALWARGMLYPSDDESRAYYVKCDSETNPEYERRQGRVYCVLGINPPYPAEYVIFKIEMWDGGVSISEEIARYGGV